MALLLLVTVGCTGADVSWWEGTWVNGPSPHLLAPRLRAEGGPTRVCTCTTSTNPFSHQMCTTWQVRAALAGFWRLQVVAV